MFSFYNYIVAIVLMMIGLYIIIVDKNLIKKLIGINIFQTSVLLFYISLSYVRSAHLPIIEPDTVKYSNPLPQVLMLTAIVVGIATFALGLSIVVRIQESYSCIEEDKIV